MLSVADAAVPGQDLVVNNLNNTLLNDGVLSGIAATDTDSQSEIIAAKNDAANSHLKYADTDAQGYALMSLSENMLNVSLVTIAGMNQDTGKRALAQTICEILSAFQHCHRGSGCLRAPLNSL